MLDRRNMLRGAVLTGAATVVSGASSASATSAIPATAGSPSAGRPAGVSLRWLGVAGWEMAFDGRVVYFDPYLSRFDFRQNGGALAIDPAIVDRLLSQGRLAGPPELIMVSHGHWDHMADVPQLLNRVEWSGTAIRTIGTETHGHLLTAMGVNDARRRNIIVATGGEDLSFGAGTYRVQVIRSLHSQSAGYGFFAPGTRLAVPPPPATINDLVEGGTLAYQVTVADRLSVLFFGGTNFAERELVGLRPDVVMVSLTDHSSLHRYLERLLKVLNGPRYAIPVHHDDLITAYDSPNLPETVNREAVAQLKRTITALRLRTEVIEPRHLEPIVF